jgi:carbamoyltransferase
MIVLGINGGLDFPYENEFNFQSVDLHDAAAALVAEGRVVSAIEEERLNRIKHSNKTSLFSAAKFVLADYGISIKDVDRVCYYMTEETCNWMLKTMHRRDFTPVRSRLARKIGEVFNYDFGEDRLKFVHHHLAHAASTYVMSGFDGSLILSIDGSGDGIAVMVLKAANGHMEALDTIDRKNSLGRFYTGLIGYLGFGHFDEYKVMGLAPYGNPEVYRDIFEAFYSLLPNGRFEIHGDYFDVLHNLEGIPRQKGEPFTQVHKDVAAAIQDALERMAFHLLKYYKDKYNHRRLCMAGGVAQNCTLNGKILYSGMFEDVFVQPASYDAGTAIGAALYTYYHEKRERPNSGSRLEHVYWGTDIGDNGNILEKLKGWQTIVDYEKVDNIARQAAQLLADGAVIGWVQGRSEFGPRALGNRSILADPRPAENKDIINAMVKKREAFRPFAPSVLEEYVEEYYVVPSAYKKFPFMTFVLDVKKEKQEILGAVTHVDGTARIQTVSRQTNRKYWDLIEEFRKITGIPVLLNTSFNNNVEPIVDSFEDALGCYLTTKLNYLAVGDYLIRKKDVDPLCYLKLVPSMPLHVLLAHTKRVVSPSESEDVYQVRDNFLTSGKSITEDALLFPDFSFGLVKANVSADLYDLLKQADGQKPLETLVKELDYRDDHKWRGLIEEVLGLWALRLLKLQPPRDD